MSYKSFSGGFPSFSYMAKKKNGKMMTIITSAETSVGRALCRARYRGNPTHPAAAKHMSCLLVSPSAILVFTWFRSFGVCTCFIYFSDLRRGCNLCSLTFGSGDRNYSFCFQCELNIDWLIEPVLNSMKHRSTVYPATPQRAECRFEATVMVFTSTA